MRPDIDAAVGRMTFKLGAKREIKRLPDHLHDGEHLAALAAGKYGGRMGLVALTDRRALFICEDWGKRTTEDFPLTRVTSVQWSAGMSTGELTIHASGNDATITHLQKPDGEAMAKAIRVAIAQPATPAQPTATTPDPAAALAALAKLHADGLITDEEFAAKRQQALNRL